MKAEIKLPRLAVPSQVILTCRKLDLARKDQTFNVRVANLAILTTVNTFSLKNVYTLIPASFELCCPPGCTNDALNSRRNFGMERLRDRVDQILTILSLLLQHRKSQRAHLIYCA